VVPFSHHVEVLTPARSLSAELAAQVPQPIGFVRADSGPYLILDRHAHTLFRMDPAWTAVRKLVEVGFGQGSLIEPGALAVNAGDVIAVADAPGGKHRIQFFTANGDVLGGFFVPATVSARLVSDRLVLNGVGSMQFKGTSFLINHPEAGGLIQELDMQGRIVRQIGELRATGYESDRALHLAFNTGLPLVDPAGGFFFVFQAGVPAFRKYDAAGTLPVRAAHRRHRDRPRHSDLAADLAWRAPGATPFRWSRRSCERPRWTRAANSGWRCRRRSRTSTTRRATRSGRCNSAGRRSFRRRVSALRGTIGCC
jgi:hypothetical protein